MSRSTSFMVGIIAIVLTTGVAYVAFRLGASEILPAPGYTIYADFDNATGLKTGDQVDIAGVPIGKVKRISLKDNRAHIGMFIKEGVRIDNGATAAIKAVGIIGGQCVSIALDSGDRYLRDGDKLSKTRSALVLEDVIGQLMTALPGKRK